MTDVVLLLNPSVLLSLGHVGINLREFSTLGVTCLKEKGTLKQHGKIDRSLILVPEFLLMDMFVVRLLRVETTSRFIPKIAECMPVHGSPLVLLLVNKNNCISAVDVK